MADENDIKIGEEQRPLWDGPDINAPKSGTVFPKFWIEASTTIAQPTEWSLEIWEGPNRIKLVEDDRNSRYFSYLVPETLIAPGTTFYFKVDWYLFPVWSRWAWSGDKVMGLGKPEITEPAVDDFTSPKPRVSGRGYPGATVKLYQAKSGAVLFGTAVVDANSDWHTIPEVGFFEGSFELTAYQTINNVDSGWADDIRITVTKFTLPKPTIVFPANGDVIKTSKPVVSGRGLPGATVRLYEANAGDVVYGSDLVPPNTIWSITPSVNFPNGEFSLTANQTSSVSGESDYAPPVNITVES